jgi:hypothetical protein
MSAPQGKPSRLQTSRLAELLAKAKLLTKVKSLARAELRVENLTALFKNYAAPLHKF